VAFFALTSSQPSPKGEGLKSPRIFSPSPLGERGGGWGLF